MERLSLSPQGKVVLGSPVLIDERIYVVNKAGDLIVLAAADEFEIPGLVELGEASYATPAT